MSTIRPTRTEEDFCWHIHHTVASDADAGWAFVADNLNTHASESLVRSIARLEGIDESTLNLNEELAALLRANVPLAQQTGTAPSRKSL